MRKMNIMNRFEQCRIRRREVYQELFTARALCIAGFIIMPALLFNPDTQFRIFQFLFFWLLAWLSGKKNNPFFTILVIIGIIAFNLVIPYGRVLFSLGVFRITSGALMTGIHRAVTLSGLVMLSRFTIRQDLKIPGFFGELIGESFRIFNLIMERKYRITFGSWKNVIAGIDRLMLDLSSANGEKNPSAVPVPEIRTKPAGFIILAVIAVLSWLPWLMYALL